MRRTSRAGSSLGWWQAGVERVRKGDTGLYLRFQGLLLRKHKCRG